MSAAKYARVAVPVPLGQAFSYAIPEALAAEVGEGARVLVSFGKRRVLGVVLRLEETIDFDPSKVKPLLAVVDPEPVIPGELLSFLVELGRYYVAPIGEVMRLALPALERSATQRLDQAGLLQGAELTSVGRLVQVVRASAAAQADAAAQAEAQADAAQGTAAEPLPAAKLKPLKGQAAALLDELRQLADWVPVTELERRFKNARGVVKRLEQRGLVEVERQQLTTDPFFAEAEADQAPELNSAQQGAVDQVLPALAAAEYAGFLLHGVTGSGKTEVYLRLVQRCLELGRGAIVLVPEIALTPQLVGRFRARVGDAIAVLHSGLSDTERHAMWKRLRSGELKVAVGARSALFAPVPELALIVVDEEHDGSFKQEEGVRYNARDMALLRAHRAGAACVIGSATPSLGSIHGVQTGRLQHLILPDRAHLTAVLPQVEIVDVRRMGPGPSGDKLLSLPLHRALQQTLEAKGQAILFLNRRGFAPTRTCAACGQISECPNCSVALTYHRARGERLVCHYCDYSAVPGERCPKCGSAELVDEGAGTERIEHLLKESFPTARIARLDRDVAAGLKSERILDAVRRGEVDILVGTQMVTKGHDLPSVTLVGVLNADAVLGMPDFRAAERTFQLLVQVAGRAGRGDAAGKVLIQTRQPDHPAIACALRHDVQAFVERELLDREELGYPPYSHVVMLRVDAAQEGAAREVARQLAEQCRALAGERGLQLEVRGPAPSPLARLRNRYRFQVMLRAVERKALRPVLLAVVRTRYDRRARVGVDVDPMSML